MAEVRIPLVKASRKKDYILVNHSHISEIDRNSRTKTGKKALQNTEDIVSTRMQLQKKQDRLRMLNESTYGLSNNSILSKDGFIKTYSKPANPDRAKNFMNPPDYSVYYEVQKHGWDPSPPKRLIREAQLAQTAGSLKDADFESTKNSSTKNLLRLRIDSISKLKQQQQKKLKYAAMTGSQLSQQKESPFPADQVQTNRNERKSNEILKQTQRTQAKKAIPIKIQRSAQIHDNTESTSIGEKTLDPYKIYSQNRDELTTLKSSYRKANENYTIQTYKHELTSVPSSKASASRFLKDHKAHASTNHLGIRPKLDLILCKKTGTRNSYTVMQKQSKSQVPTSIQPGSGLVQHKANSIKLRAPLLEKLNDLIVKKQLDEERDPRNRMWRKDVLLTNSMKALELQLENPISASVGQAAEKMSPTFKSIQKQFEESKMIRQRSIDRDNWICSFDESREGYDVKHLNRVEENPSAGAILEYKDGFKPGTTIISHITGIIGQRDREASKSNRAGSVNHITRAIGIKEGNFKEEEQRRKGAAIHNLDKQNELFPNNLEFKMKQKMLSNRLHEEIDADEKTLEEKLENDTKALIHQRFLIDGVMKTLGKKRLNYNTASNGMLKNNTEKWLRIHDKKTEVASVSNTRGAFFGSTRPLRKPLQIGQQPSVAKSFYQEQSS